MALRVQADVLNDAVNGAVDNVDVGATELNGSIEFYTGTRPANLGDATAETLLAVVDFQDPAFGAAASGSAAALGVPLATTGLAAGDIGWARILDKDNAIRWDENDVGTAGNAITVNTITVSVGLDIEVTAYDFSAS